MRKIILEILRKAVGGGVSVESSPDEKFGHYSTNAAFRIAKEKKISPLAAAEKIKAEILKIAPAGFFERIEVAPPGFLNFWLNQRVFQKNLLEILKQKKNYGKAKAKKPFKVQVEFVSANPTGPLTLANGRGGFLGDVLSNVLEAAGYDVEREYYVNDTGNQIAVLGKSLVVALGLNIGQLSAEEKDNLYQGEYVKKWACAHKNIIKKYQKNPLKLGQITAKDFLMSIKKVLKKKAGIIFDKWTSEEKDIHKKKLVEKALAVFRKKGFVYEKDGAVWLKTSGFGDDKDRVLVTSDGRPTYFLADGGHYLQTFERGFKKKINILGPDHYGYVKRIQAVAKIFGFEQSDVIITQALRLVKNGKEVKMSKRKGQFVTFEELVDEVGADAARFFFLMVSYDSHMDFDMALAKEKSNKNPVYYAQYAYVRCASILRKCKNQKSKIKMTDKNAKLDFLNTSEDIKLMRELVRFSEVIEDTASDYQTHRLTRYATELARAFHNFYEKERIIGEAQDIAAARLILVRATEIIFKNLFSILGISAPEKM